MDEDAPIAMRWPGVAARVAGLIVLVPVLYVLSMGPVNWLFALRSDALDRFIDRFYEPATELAIHAGVRRSMDAYILWWWILPGGGYERSQAKWLHDKAQPLPLGTLAPAMDEDAPFAEGGSPAGVRLRALLLVSLSR